MFILKANNYFGFPLFIRREAWKRLPLKLSIIVFLCIGASSNGSSLALTNTSINTDNLLEQHPTPLQLNYSSTSPPIQIAAPENFNPGLRLPSSPQPSLQEPISAPESPQSPSGFALESLTTDFRNDQDNFERRNQFIEETAQFRLANGDRLRVKTGWNSFDDSEVESIANIPVQVSWERKSDRVTLEVGGGVDFFDRLPAAPNFHARAEVPIGLNIGTSGELQSGLILSGIVEHGPYKFNAQTLDNRITVWRGGPNVYWQIDPNTSLFSFLRLGLYNDGNQEWQSFSRLERKLGEFSIAANLFTWSYEEDLETESGYFSPSDFLVYNAELAWEGDVFDFLRCRLGTTLGQQRLRGDFDLANSYQARCTVKFSPQVEANLGYSLSNVRNQNTEESSYNNQTITGQLRIRF